MEQIRKVGLELGTFENKNLQSVIKITGQLKLAPQNKASVSAMTAGRVKEIHIHPGHYVKKGAILATIQNPDFINWQQAYLEVQGALMYLDKEYIRLQELVEKEIAPKKELEKVLSERSIAQAKLKGLRSKMKVVGIKTPDTGSEDLKSTVNIYSPIKGFIEEININTGVFVEAHQSLFEIVDNHNLHIDFMVFEKDLPSITVGQMIQFTLQSNPEKVRSAKVFSIGKVLDEKQRTISIHATIVDDKKDLLQGMYVEGRVILEDRQVPALPEEAIAQDNGLHYIFIEEEVHEDETHFKKVPVMKLAADFGYVQIDPLEELENRSGIVTKGAYFLMAQSKKGEEGAGHHHH